jgi:hypothetical protein
MICYALQLVSFLWLNVIGVVLTVMFALLLKPLQKK